MIVRSRAFDRDLRRGDRVELFAASVDCGVVARLEDDFRLPPIRGSRHSVAVGHPEAGHRVKNPARELHLHALAGPGATPHASADDRLVSIDRVLHHTAFAVARSFVPRRSAESEDGADAPIPLL